MAKVYVEFEEPESCYDCPLFYATEGAFCDRCQLTNEKAEKINIWKEKLENCPLKKVEERENKLRQFEEGEIVCIKHYEAIKNFPILKEQVEDWKADHEHNLELMKGLNERIAELEKENEELRKNQIVWHNPDELPPVYENSSFSINVLNENGEYVEYNFDAHHWIIAGTNRKILIKKWTDSFPSSCK